MRAALRLLIAIASLCAALPALGQAFGPGGAEARANTFTSGDQSDPSTAIDVLTGSMVVWQSAGQDGDGLGIYGQRFVQGSPIGVEFRVNTSTSGDQRAPRVSVGGGRYVVVWQDDGGKDGSGSGIYGQRFDNTGPVGSEFRVTITTSGNQTSPAVASDGAGNFVVAWAGPGSGDQDGIWARGFSSTGAAVGSELRMNTYTTALQSDPAVAMPVGAGFSFVVVWASEGQDGPKGIFGQRAGILAGPDGAEFRVNSTTALSQDQPAIATSPNTTGHVIVWRKVNGASDTEIVGQRYGGGALPPLGSEFRVNAFTGQHDRPSAAMDGATNFMVVWTDASGEDGDAAGAFARHYAAGGVPAGAEFHVNARTTGAQTQARAAAYTAGEFRIVWASSGQDGSGTGVYTQLFCHNMLGDANYDKVVNVSDVLFLINYLFAGGPAPFNPSDVNLDHTMNVQDILYLINFLFAAGPAPAGCIV